MFLFLLSCCFLPLAGSKRYFAVKQCCRNFLLVYCWFTNLINIPSTHVYCWLTCPELQEQVLLWRLISLALDHPCSVSCKSRLSPPASSSNRKALQRKQAFLLSYPVIHLGNHVSFLMQSELLVSGFLGLLLNASSEVFHPPALVCSSTARQQLQAICLVAYAKNLYRHWKIFHQIRYA